MQQQEQKQTKRDKKTYAELLEEFANTKKRIAVVYVPLLCEAMRDENPNKSYLEIKEKVVSDSVEQGWNEPYIVRCLPSWIHEADPYRDYKHERTLKSWESRNKNKLKEMHRKVALINEQVPEPPNVREPEYEDVEDDAGKFEPQGEKGISLSTRKKRINEAANDLYKALTDREELPEMDDDFIVDHLKPTRAFRKGLAIEFNEIDRASIHTRLNDAVQVALDMIEIIDDIDKGK